MLHIPFFKYKRTLNMRSRIFVAFNRDYLFWFFFKALLSKVSVGYLLNKLREMVPVFDSKGIKI